MGVGSQVGSAKPLQFMLGEEREGGGLGPCFPDSNVHGPPRPAFRLQALIQKAGVPENPHFWEGSCCLWCWSKARTQHQALGHALLVGSCRFSLRSPGLQTVIGPRGSPWTCVATQLWGGYPKVSMGMHSF